MRGWERDDTAPRVPHTTNGHMRYIPVGMFTRSFYYSNGAVHYWMQWWCYPHPHPGPEGASSLPGFKTHGTSSGAALQVEPEPWGETPPNKQAIR